MSNIDIILSIVSVTLLVLLLISGIILVVFQSGKQRLRQEMEMSESKLNYEKELRKVETEVSEQVLGQLAQELHDNIGQLLTAVHIHLENQKLDHPELKEGYKPMETYLSEAIQQLKLLSRTLNNDYIGHNGLLAAIEIEVNRLKSLRRFEIHWDAVSGGSNLDKNQELMAFRLFQEIIQNALRHSMAKDVYLSVKNDAGNFSLKVEDNGKGFDVESIMQSSKASGLRNIIKRAQWAGLDYKINSSPGNGCTITLEKVAVMRTA